MQSKLSVLLLAAVLFNLPCLGFTNLNLRALGAMGDGMTDDTAAIQSAFNLAVSNYPSGATIEADSGTYLFSHLVFPPAVNPSLYGETVKLVGPSFPAQAFSVIDATAPSFGGAIFKCTATTGDAVSIVSATGFFNPITVELENLTFLFPDNPGVTGLNFRKAYALRMRGVTLWTGTAPYAAVLPTASASVGVATPANNNGAFTRLDDVAVSGFYTGFELNEHTVANELSAWTCVQGVTFPEAYHANHINRMMIVRCAIGIVFSGQSKVVIDEYDIERVSSGWPATQWDIYDPQNLGSANITWAAVLANVGTSHSLTVDGGANILAREVGGNFPAAGGGGGGTSTNPPTSQVTTNLYASWDADSVTTSTTNLWADSWTNHLDLSAFNPSGTLFSEINGHNALNFTGGSYAGTGAWYSNGVYSVNQPNEVFVVAKIGGNFTDYGAVIDSESNAANRQVLAYYVSSGNLDFYAGSDIQGVRMPASWCVFDVVFNGSSGVVYTNGTVAVSGNCGAWNGRGLLVGAIPGYAPKAIMKLARIDSYSTVLDSGSRSNQLSWLKARYNIP